MTNCLAICVSRIYGVNTRPEGADKTVIPLPPLGLGLDPRVRVRIRVRVWSLESKRTSNTLTKTNLFFVEVSLVTRDPSARGTAGTSRGTHEANHHSAQHATCDLLSSGVFFVHSDANEVRIVKFSRLYTSNMFQPRLRPSVTWPRCSLRYLLRYGSRRLE